MKTLRYLKYFKVFSAREQYDSFIFSAEKISEKYLRVVHSNIEHLPENAGREKNQTSHLAK